MIEDLIIVLTAKPLSLSLKILFFIPVKFLLLSFPLKKESFKSNLSQDLNIPVCTGSMTDFFKFIRKIRASLVTRSLSID